MAVKSGKVTKIEVDASTSPATRTFMLHDPDPPPDGTDYPFTPCPAELWTVVVAAYTKDSDCDVEYDTAYIPKKVTAK